MVAALAALALFAVGCIPDDGVGDEGGGFEATPTTAPPGGARLEALGYHVGQCVTWDQDAAGAQADVTRTVSCREPHLLEITGSTLHPSLARYPTDDQWLVFFRTGACQTYGETFLGGPIDPYGAFSLAGIKPSATAWTVRGVRDVTCGIAARSDDPNPARLAPKVGTAKGQDQTVIRPAGACVVREPAPATSKPVPCTGPHSYEVTGVVDLLGGATSRPTTPGQWEALVGADCRRLAEARLGRPPDGRVVRATWFEIEPGSWNAGRRKVECAVGRYGDNGEALTFSGPLRDSLN